MKTVRNVFQLLSFIFVIIVILIFLIPYIFGIKPYIVLSGSMEPVIETGSVVYINTHVGFDEIKEGDIIGFKENDAKITHRVVKINSDNTFTTKGDANKSEDLKTISPNEYLGKNVFNIPKIGKLIEKVKTKMGIFVVFLFIGINILLIIFEDDEEPRNKKNEPKEEKENE